MMGGGYGQPEPWAAWAPEPAYNAAPISRGGAPGSQGAPTRHAPSGYGWGAPNPYEAAAQEPWHSPPSAPGSYAQPPSAPRGRDLTPIQTPPAGFHDLRRGETEDALEELRRGLLDSRAGAPSSRVAAPLQTPTPSNAAPLQELQRWMEEADIEPEVREVLTGAVALRLDRNPTQEEVERAFIQELLARVRVRPIEALERRRIIAFVGPTGAGKTTALARLAVDWRLHRRRTVGIIAVDPWRISATATLERIADLLQAPFELAQDRASLERALRRLDHCDTILIDTTGRSPRDQESLQQLSQIFDGVPGLSVELCVAASTAPRDLRGITRSYGILRPENLLCTKLDEAFAIGPVLSVHLRGALPLSWFTTGQRVPEDIEPASIERVLGMILPLED
jgi:flagellar biosynthesis GTPase FlhF